MAIDLLSVLKPVESSMFSRAGYDDSGWNLLLEFKSTRELRCYRNVAPEMADEMLHAESIGKWWNQNVKGNPGWEFEVLLSAETKTEKKPDPAPLSVIDEDIKNVEPGWDGEKINTGIPADADVPQHVYSTYGGIDRKAFHVSEVGHWPTDMDGKPMSAEEVQAGTPEPAEPGFFAKEYEAQSAMTTQTHGEVLAKWEAPESAAEALDMMGQHEREIKAIIAQSEQTKIQALSIKVTTPDMRIEAGALLTRLVEKKDGTFALLDPFRRVLYEAYTEAGTTAKAGVDPLVKAIEHVKAQCLAWDAAIERDRQRQIREAREAAEAESRRIQAEQSQQLTLNEVHDALEVGDTAKAEELIERPIEVPRPYVQPTYMPPATPKTEGQSKTTSWKVDRELLEEDESGQAYIASITAMLQAVKGGSYPIDQAAPLLEWNFGKADSLAKAMMGAFNVPGLTASPKTTMRVSGKKKSNK